MSEETQEGAPPELGDPTTKTILIVDDDESILDLMEHIIKKEGFKVERAEDGQSAVQKAGQVQPDLIVLDFMLPGLGGFEVIRELQGDVTSSIPILVITGRRIDRQTIEMIKQESNVKEYIEKPVRPAALGWTIHRILKTRPPDMNRIVDRGPAGGGW